MSVREGLILAIVVAFASGVLLTDIARDRDASRYVCFERNYTH